MLNINHLSENQTQMHVKGARSANYITTRENVLDEKLVYADDNNSRHQIYGREIGVRATRWEALMRIERGSFSKHLQSRIIKQPKAMAWPPFESSRLVETIPMKGHFK